MPATRPADVTGAIDGVNTVFTTDPYVELTVFRNTVTIPRDQVEYTDPANGVFTLAFAPVPAIGARPADLLEALINDTSPDVEVEVIRRFVGSAVDAAQVAAASSVSAIASVSPVDYSASVQQSAHNALASQVASVSGTTGACVEISGIAMPSVYAASSVGMVADGVTDNTSALAAFIAAHVGECVTLVFNQIGAPYVIAGPLTIPETVTLFFAPGAKVSVSSGVVVHDGRIVDTWCEIFDGAGLFSAEGCEFVRPEWYGAILESDSSLSVQTAIDVAAISGAPVRLRCGTWIFGDVEPLSGTHIIAERGTRIEAPGGSGAILRDPSGAGTKRIHIEGGTWASCDRVLHRENTSSLDDSTFRNMTLDADVCGLDVETLAGAIVEACRFTGAIGIRFGGNTTSAASTIRSCHFTGCTDAVVFSYGSSVSAMVLFDACRFEDCSGRAALIDVNAQLIVFEHCYFEGNGSSDTHDIEVTRSMSPGANRLVTVRRCFFGDPHPSQTSERIGLLSLTQANVDECHVALQAGQNFIRHAISNVYHNRYFDNYLNAIGGGDYIDRLVTDASTSEFSWNAFRTSGFVGEDSPRTRLVGTLTVDDLVDL